MSFVPVSLDREPPKIYTRPCEQEGKTGFRYGQSAPLRRFEQRDGCRIESPRLRKLRNSPDNECGIESYLALASDNLISLLISPLRVPRLVRKFRYFEPHAMRVWSFATAASLRDLIRGVSTMSRAFFSFFFFFTSCR